MTIERSAVCGRRATSQWGQHFRTVYAKGHWQGRPIHSAEASLTWPNVKDDFTIPYELYRIGESNLRAIFLRPRYRGVVDQPATEMPEWTRGSTVDLTFRLRTANRRPCICSHHATFSLNNHDGSFCSIAILKNRFRRQLALCWSLGQS